DDVAAGGKSASPGSQVFFDAPYFLSGCRIPRNKLTAVTARARMTDDDCSDVGLAGLILHFDTLVIHAQIIRRNVEEIRSWREGHGLLVLASHCGWADVFRVLRCGSQLFGNLDRPAGLQIHTS